MGRVTKIGLAGGILLLGAACAYFFRKPMEQPVVARRAPVPSQALPSAATKQGNPKAVVSESAPTKAPRPKTESRAPAPATAVAKDTQPAWTWPSMRPAAKQPSEPAQIRPTVRQERADPFTAQREVFERQTQEPRVHVVRDGDTLYRLAERYLGDENGYWELYERNRDILPSPDILPIGARLKVPPRAPPNNSNPPGGLVPIPPNALRQFREQGGN